MVEVLDLSLLGPKLLKPKVFADERGFFCECYKESLYKDLGIEVSFVQDNHSFSKKGVIRGMHFQTTPGQAKLVTVLEGAIFDVVVDVRKDSKTFGKWEGVILDSLKHEQLYVPVGFAHGFCVISEGAHVMYKVSCVYSPAAEKSFLYNDPEVDIKWPIQNPLLSSKDRQASLLREVL